MTCCKGCGVTTDHADLILQRENPNEYLCNGCLRKHLELLASGEVRGRATVSSTSLVILLIEDNPGVSRTLSRILRGRGHAVTVTDHVNDALARMNSTAYDVIVIDRWVNGINAWNKVLDGPHHGPCIDSRLVYMSADLPRAYPEGVFLKGDNPEKLIQMIENTET